MAKVELYYWFTKLNNEKRQCNKYKKQNHNKIIVNVIFEIRQNIAEKSLFFSIFYDAEMKSY